MRTVFHPAFNPDCRPEWSGFANGGRRWIVITRDGRHFTIDEIDVMHLPQPLTGVVDQMMSMTIGEEQPFSWGGKIRRER